MKKREAESTRGLCGGKVESRLCARARAVLRGARGATDARCAVERVATRPPWPRVDEQRRQSPSSATASVFLNHPCLPSTSSLKRQLAICHDYSLREGVHLHHSRSRTHLLNNLQMARTHFDVSLVLVPPRLARAFAPAVKNVCRHMDGGFVR